MIDMHIHSIFSDGKDCPEDIVNAAIDLGLAAVAICEHVRRETEWFEDYQAEVERLKKKYVRYIRVYSAIEAKILDISGNIDARPEFFQSDLVYAAIHRIPCGDKKFCKGFEDDDLLKKCWLLSLESAISKNKQANILAHLFYPALQYNFRVSIHEIDKIASLLIQFKKTVELNLKYAHPAMEHLLGRLAGKVPLIIGSDSHSVKEMYERKNERETAWRKWGNFVEFEGMQYLWGAGGSFLFKN